MSLAAELVPEIASAVLTAPYVPPHLALRASVTRDFEGEPRLSELEAVSERLLFEDCWALCRGVLVFLGRFSMGIPPQTLLEAKDKLNAVGYLHTHPVPIHIPSPEDVLNAYQLETRIECVAARFEVNAGRALCLEVDYPRKWLEVYHKLLSYAQDVLSHTSRFIAVESQGEIVLVPYPTPSEALAMERTFVEIVENLVDVEIIEVANGEFSVHTRACSLLALDPKSRRGRAELCQPTR